VVGESELSQTLKISRSFALLHALKPSIDYKALTLAYKAPHKPIFLSSRGVSESEKDY